MRRRIAALLVVVFVLPGCGHAKKYEGVSAPPADGARVVFTRSSQQGLFLLNPASRRVQRLTDGADIEPRWSPNGRFIAFARDRPVAIWVLDYRSGSLHRIGAGAGPVWSANGTTLYFLCHRPQYGPQSLCARRQPTALHGPVAIYPLPFLTSGLERVTDRQFVLSTLGEGLWLWSIGAKPRHLTPGVLDLDWHARLGPDEFTVLFTRAVDEGEIRIESIGLWNGKTQVVSHPQPGYADDDASWIPKSDKIVFVRSTVGSYGVPNIHSTSVIATMARDGKVLSRLKAVQGLVGDLDWRP
jgi:hypothetical protein